MKIYSEYKNYQDYVDIQTETNKIKIGVTWVIPQEIESLCEYIVREVQLNNSSTNNHVMCHGMVLKLSILKKILMIIG